MQQFNFKSTVSLFCLLACAASVRAQGLSVNFASYIPNTSLYARDIHTDCQGNVIVVGGTADANFTCTPGTASSAYNGGDSDVWVMKMDSLGNTLWQTLLGGPFYDRAYAVEVDDDGFIYVAGRADDGFPVTSCAFQQTFGGDDNPNGLYGPQDGFITKMTPDGNIIWSSFLGGDGPDIIRDFDIDTQGNVYAGFAGANPIYPHITSDAVQGIGSTSSTTNTGLVKISSDGQEVLYGTFITDGSNTSGVPAVRVKGGHVFLMSSVQGPGAPVTAGAYQTTHAGAEDIVLTKLDLDGGLIFCTYLGGSGGEGIETHTIEVDDLGRTVLATITNSTDFPVTTGAYQTSSSGGSSEGFVSILSVDGSTLVHSTYFGGSNHDEFEGIAIDDLGRIYVTGNTRSTDMPVTTDAYQGTHVNQNDGLLAVFSADLSTLEYSTYWGGNNLDLLRCGHVDPLGRLFIAGGTRSGNLPIQNAQHPTLTPPLTSMIMSVQIGPSQSPDPNCNIATSFLDPCLDCPTDINGDGSTDINDFLLLNTAFGQSCASCPEDIDANGVVDVSDFLAFNSHFGLPCD